ncbi:MAG: type II secretion system F family protein [Planctomycetales bacterium]|nr:type II secretion system F family protein [Planctomycetales bacterium]
MLQVTLFFGWLTLVALVAAGWRGMRQRELAWQRLAEVDGRLAPQDPVRVGTRRLHRRWIWAPWALALAVATVVALVFQLSMPYVVALGLMFGLLASQIESFLAARHVAVLETQLADAIDIMIGAVGAGASVGTAIEAAITECRSPLRPYLEEVAGRIRLGDEPAEVFRSLAQRVPLETFLLFTSALSVHWEVGGKLSSTLTTVGKTIRDRIDISRRIRSNTAQSQFSTLAIVGLTYFIAVIVWRNGPDQMEDFVRSPIGSWFVAGSVILQAVGIVWMNLISKPRF